MLNKMIKQEEDIKKLNDAIDGGNLDITQLKQENS